MTRDAHSPTRRGFLDTAARFAGGLGLLLTVAPGAARATPASMQSAMKKIVGEATLAKGKVKLELPPLVENGNSVSMTVSVADPPSPVEAIHVFAEGNPLPRVAVFHFGPRSGAPRVATRMRLATSQTVIAIAKLRDGTCWRDSVDLLVTLAACIE